ncbi:MAG: tyrosine--tRNA ligase [Clostridia bacterium]|nr:tyrosine--tRNA ligase [Clostridia bacterium]
MTVYEDLQWRGLIKDISSEDLIEKLNNGKITFYLGTDPTADSLHIGHYSTFLVAKRLQKAGHNPILLVGGATGLVGDPRGTGEREKADAKVIESNYTKLKAQVERLFDIKCVNNYDWFKDVNYIDFLRDYGKYINVNYMINKDLVRRQLEIGISYAEFSYMLIQGVDFKHLHDTYGVTLQIGGSDQWGNLTTGIEIIRKLTGDEVYAFSIPLATDSQGKKMGKSEGNAVWLDIDKTSAYELYQYLFNLEDSMMEAYLKRFTFLSKPEIEEIMKQHLEAPEKRIAQEALAHEVIRDIHGEEEYQKAVEISRALFSGDIKKIPTNLIGKIFSNVDHIAVSVEENIVDFLANNKICSSKREAREFLNNGSIYINGEKVTDLELVINKDVALEDKYVVIRKGKKKYFLGEFING